MKWTTAVGDFFRVVGRGMPIFGPLAHCTRKNHVDACKEFFINILFGTATFWATAFMLRGLLIYRGTAYGDRLYETVESGQLFIFAVAMLGPILLTTSDDPTEAQKFPGRPWHLTALLILGLFGSGFYAMSLALRKGNEGVFDKDFLFFASVVVALSAVVLRYLTVVYRRSTANVNVEKTIKAPEVEFLDAFNDRHGEEQ